MQKSEDCQKAGRKTDRRAIYTRSVIMEAYVKLLKRRPREKIRITELCKLAGINRCTFYLHFEDITEVEKAIVRRVLSDIDQLNQAQNNTPSKRLEISQIFMDKLMHDDTYRTLMAVQQKDYLGAYVVHEFYTEYYQKANHDHQISDSGLSEREQKLMYYFLAGGVMAVQQFWAADELDHLNEDNKFLDALVGSVLKCKL